MITPGPGSFYSMACPHRSDHGTENIPHHADELDSVQMKWKKGYYTAQDGHVVPNTAFYPSKHPWTAIDDPAFHARQRELEEEEYRRHEEAAAVHNPHVWMNSANGLY